MITFIDRILKNPRLLKLKDPDTGEIKNFEIQDYTDDEVTQEGTEINATVLNQAFLDMHPVNSIYITFDITDPGNLFGGTWELVGKNRFLVGAGDKYNINSTGGNSSITLTKSQIPKHSHSIPQLTGATTYSGAHTHTGRYSQYGAGGSKLVLRRISGEDEYKGIDQATNEAGLHNHTITTNASTTGETGGTTEVNIMPPYLACYFWKRIA